MSNDAPNGASQTCPHTIGDRIGRDHNRTGSLLLTVVRWGDAPSRLVSVRNVSSAGLMGEMDNPPLGGQAVEFKLGALGWRGASVVWRVAHRFGARFHEEIDPPGFDCEAE